MKYKRILLKLSGESLMGAQQYGIDQTRLKVYASEIAEAASMGVQIAIVIGGGNIFRGIQGTGQGFDRAQGDYMGMLATLINSLALQSAIEEQGISTKLLSGLPINPIAEPMSGRIAKEYLSKGTIVIIGGGTGNPYFTTDTASALRAIEINADAIFKGTRVDGVYDADPEKHPEAKKFKNISFDEAYQKQLKIMDLTAFTLCNENKMPIFVFDMNTKGNLKKALMGEEIGTIVKN
ncbi:MAG: UMP kinase [Bacteroidetes bacterium HGW-Bacteroidetes-17]|jgi:uridylate kinase|nr:MAG: UMP kinase [Bacteroidetes bacterium HGW-Bacteroidetes-17]